MHYTFNISVMLLEVSLGNAKRSGDFHVKPHLGIQMLEMYRDAREVTRATNSIG